MTFDIKQINNLLTGVVLACELKSNNPEMRKFVTVKSFKIDSNGKYSVYDNKVKSADIGNKALFIFRCYSVLAKWIELDYDIDDDYLTDSVIINDIIGWDKLYEILSEYLDDLSILLPQWNCDNPVE